jgi:hypothetical protein
VNVLITDSGAKNRSDSKAVTSQVAEKIQEELEDYRAREDDIKRMKHEMGVEGESDFAIGMLSDNTQVPKRYC